MTLSRTQCGLPHFGVPDLIFFIGCLDVCHQAPIFSMEGLQALPSLRSCLLTRIGLLLLLFLASYKSFESLSLLRMLQILRCCLLIRGVPDTDRFCLYLWCLWKLFFSLIVGPLRRTDLSLFLILGNFSSVITYSTFPFHFSFFGSTSFTYVFFVFIILMIIVIAL